MCRRGHTSAPPRRPRAPQTRRASPHGGYIFRQAREESSAFPRALEQRGTAPSNWFHKSGLQTGLARAFRDSIEIAVLNARVSRTVTMAKVDGRSAFGQLIRQVRSDLVQHVGGKPTAVQRMLIERAATLTGYLARLDGDALSPAGMSDHRRREYLAADGALPVAPCARSAWRVRSVVAPCKARWRQCSTCPQGRDDRAGHPGHPPSGRRRPATSWGSHGVLFGQDPLGRPIRPREPRRPAAFRGVEKPHDGRLRP